MRESILVYVLLAVILQATTLGECQESGGVLAMEAENGTIGSRWLISADTEASDDAYVEIDPVYNHTGSSAPECTTPECLVSYDFAITTSGNYSFWFRMHSANGSDDSFFWRVDDSSWNLENNRYGIGSWFSTNNMQVDDLGAGSHVLEIGYRENGTRLDKFVIQLDSLADPSGEGPTESSIGSNDPCYNLLPQVDGPKAILAIVGKPLLLDVTASDDGKPYVEGCDPEDPDTGTSYPFEFQWAQQSGPGAVVFNPASADQQAVTITFPLQGMYALSLDVSDAPAGVADRKTTRYTITVEVIEALDGDIDFNRSVNLDDLMYLVDQWLLSCNGAIYCADLDDSGFVTLDDFTQIASNWMTVEADVIINEFVASNRLSHPDGDGNYSDWIELYNLSVNSISLDGWYLTDDKNNLQKWPFPLNAVISGEAYLVVFASGQSTNNYIDAGGNLHTNFALDKDGEYLAIVSPEGSVVHEYDPAYPPQETDFSYGLWYDLVRYFETTTPGQANSDAFPGFTDKPNYSVDRGFYDQPFTLEITSDAPGAFIRYTLDGSEPTEQHGTIYDPNTPLQISTTTVVRSVAIKSPYRPGNTKTATYIFIDDVAQQPTDPAGWPDNWGSEPAQYSGPAIPEIFADYEMDPRVVNNTLPGYSVQEALMDIPSISIAMEPDEFIGPEDGHGLWANPLITTEYKCSIEYIPIDGSDDFQEDCKVENHGFSSRYPQRMQKHNLRLTFTSEYGASKLKHLLFPDSPVETFNQLILRAFSTDSWALVSWGDTRYRPNDSQYIRDVWMKKSLRDMGQPSSYGNYVHLYVNGLYFGMFDVTESVDESFFAEHFGGDSEDWTVGKDFSGVPVYWNTLLITDVSSLAGYEQSLNYIDVENFADYMLLHFYADCEDWPHHNGIVANNTVSGDGKMRFFVWDQAISLDSHGKALEKIDNSNGVGAIFQKMRTSEEFRLLFADRVYKHCFNDGALSVSGSQNRYLEVANMIDKAIVAESARWGDTQMSTSYGSTIVQPNPLDDINHNLYPPVPNEPKYYFTREGSWVVERDNIINNYIPAIHDTNNWYAIVNLFRDNNLYPAIDPPSLMIEGVYQYGGHVGTDDVLTMVNPNGNGTIYYTLDGSDPRLPGGAVNTVSATSYSGDITLFRSTIVKARIKSDETWSALAEATYAAGSVAENLRITEIMYHPADPNTEFIEVQNISTTETVNLNLVELNKGVDIIFGDMTLAPNEYALIVQDQTAFEAKYGIALNIVGQYTGRLDNDGDRIKFKDAIGTEILDFNYKDSWYELTDGYGFTLTMINPASTDPNVWDSKAGWRSSLYEGGTPGQAPILALAADSIVINELLAHSHDTNPDWIELRNTTGQDINISGWFLSDDDSDPNEIRKYEIPANTIINAGGYKVFYEDESFGDPALPVGKGFGLSEGGETLYVHSGQDGDVTGYYQAQQKFDASDTDISFGRYEKPTLSGGYDFTRMVSKTNTFPFTNSGPKIADIVITEIYYSPANGDTAYEFMELYNRSGSLVTLMSLANTEVTQGNIITENIGWHIEGISFDFPTDPPITMAANERIIIARDPDNYSSLTTVQVLGPCGKLDNGGEELELQIPGDQEYGKDRYWIPIEKIKYDNDAPWPSADENGKSLQRLDADTYGRDYSNWKAETLSPGS